MKLHLSLLVALLLLNGLAASMRGGMADERTRLESRLREREASSARNAVEATRDRALRELIESGRKRGLPRHLSVGAVRALLIDTQRGLPIDRISLEFRPAENRGPNAAEGSQISANLAGSYEGLFDYLNRVEALRLPLALQALSLQRDVTTGVVGLTVRWVALWRAPGALDADEIASLRRWLHRGSLSRPDRDPFSERGRPPAAAPEHASGTPLPDAPEPDVPEVLQPTRPVLIGFVVARPELEEDVHRRVLGALRYEGDVHLVAVGDRIGVYRVESIEARERVELLNTSSGERIVLELP